MNRLLSAYKTAISSMDTSIVRPFSEFEVQPLFAREWISRTIPLYLNFDFTGNLSYNFLNRSVTRSMYLTDLLDNYYANSTDQKQFRETLEVLKTFWNKVFTEFYGNQFFGADPFSQFYNCPLQEKIHSEYYFYHNSQLFETLALCFAISYAKNFDIMADNTYEITGPFTRHEHLIQKNTFHKVFCNKTIVFYTWKLRKVLFNNINRVFNPPPSQQIDIFGHSRISDLSNISGFIENTPILPSTVHKLNIQLSQELNYWIYRTRTTSYTTQLCYYLQRRLERYKKLGVILNIDSLIEQPQPLFPKLVKEQMIKTLEVAMGI